MLKNALPTYIAQPMIGRLFNVLNCTMTLITKYHDLNKSSSILNFILFYNFIHNLLFIILILFYFITKRIINFYIIYRFLKKKIDLNKISFY